MIGDDLSARVCGFKKKKKKEIERIPFVINCDVFVVVIEDGVSFAADVVIVCFVSAMVESNDVVVPFFVVDVVNVEIGVVKDMTIELVDCVVAIVPHPTSPIFVPCRVMPKFFFV